MWACSTCVSTSSHALLNPAISSRTYRIEGHFHRKISNDITERIRECSGLSCRSAPRDVTSLDPLDIPEEELKDLIRQGLSMKDTIKVGRRGACQYVVDHIKKRWNTSKVRQYNHTCCSWLVAI